MQAVLLSEAFTKNKVELTDCLTKFIAANN